MVRATEFMANWRVICRPIVCFPPHCKGCVRLSAELTQPNLGRSTIGAVISFAFKLPSSPFAHSKFALLRTVKGCPTTSIQLESEVIFTQPSGKFTRGAVGFAGLFRPSLLRAGILSFLFRPHSILDPFGGGVISQCHRVPPPSLPNEELEGERREAARHSGRDSLCSVTTITNLAHLIK